MIPTHSKTSSLWRTILLGLFLGLILTMLVTSGAFMLGFPGSPLIVLGVLMLAAIAVAVRIPKHRTLAFSAMGGGLTGTIASFLAVFVLFSGGLFSTNSQDDLKPAELEQWIGMDFPDSATNMRSHAEGFQDWQVFVRFEMPKSDMANFLKTNNLELEAGTGTVTYFMNDELKKDWWKPEMNQFEMFKPKAELGSQTQPTTKTGFYPTVQISDLEGGTVTVYITAFNT